MTDGSAKSGRTCAGASTREHPAPYPLELAARLIRMFSFVGDTVYDPFTGTATNSGSRSAIRAEQHRGRDRAPPITPWPKRD